MNKIKIVLLTCLFCFSTLNCSFAKETTNQDKQIDIIDFTDLEEKQVDRQMGLIIYNSDQYIGKVLKCKGKYIKRNDGTHFCSFIRKNVGDPIGVEFILNSNLNYPKDRDIIAIQGEISYYKDKNGKQIYLKNAKYIKSK